jgi:CelD/BcsL family acetyltransferase involved in cellulose biosynthesis
MTVVNSPEAASRCRALGGLTSTVFDSFDLVDVTREEWDQFVLNVGGDLYVTYDWCRIWWRHYGADRLLRLYIFRNGSRLAGLAPMFIESVRLGPVKLRMAKRVGADFALTVFSLPLAADGAEDAYRQLIIQMIEQENCDAVWFGFMPGDDPTLNGLRGACRSLQNVTVLRDAPAGPHTLFRLPGNFTAYCSRLTKKHRQDYRRIVNLLNRTFKIECDVVREPSKADEALKQFRILHDDQWREEGMLGHFGDWPGSTLFNTDIVRELAKLGRFRMVRTIADGKLVSAQYGFVFGNSCYWRLPARAIARELERFSLGRFGLMQLIEAMINEGVRRIEAGIGRYDYKIQLGGEQLELRTLLVVTNRPAVMLRARIFLMLSQLLHLTYYRVWFGRLAPRIPLPRRCLWRTWIRSRIR